MFVTNLKQFHGIETNVIHMCYLNFFTDAYFLAHLHDSLVKNNTVLTCLLLISSSFMA